VGWLDLVVGWILAGFALATVWFIPGYKLAGSGNLQVIISK
jgi:hypothetical protein